MIKIYCNEKLSKTLESNNVKDYVPAYEGESAGLDLYNSGEDTTIMPSLSIMKPEPRPVIGLWDGEFLLSLSKYSLKNSSKGDPSGKRGIWF